jgi:hypothetical protein
LPVSELAPRREPEQGFFLDGYYLGVMVFKAMPRSTWPKTMEPFFALTIPNLRVVVNMRPLPVERNALRGRADPQTGQ